MRVQSVTATPLVVYRQGIQNPRSIYPIALLIASISNFAGNGLFRNATPPTGNDPIADRVIVYSAR
jgi:hypothetical protein